MLDDPARLDHPRVDLKGLKNTPATEILDAVELTAHDWEERPDSPERGQALKNIQGDLERMRGLGGDTMQDLASGLVASHKLRNQRLKNFSRLGLGLALGGFFSAMAGFAPGLAVGAAGVVLSAGSALARQDSPSLDTLGRLPSYAGVAGQVQEANALVDALSRTDERVQVEDQGVWVGDNYLPLG